MTKAHPKPKRKLGAATTQSLDVSLSRQPLIPSPDLVADVRALIDNAQKLASRAVNSVIEAIYWSIGQRIHSDILQDKRAEYGKQILATLSQELATNYGRGYAYSNLTRMVKFVVLFPDRTMVSALSTQLGLNHFVEIIAVDDPLKREFYEEICRVESGIARTLRQKIGGMLLDRTALSKKPVEMTQQELAALRSHDQLSPDLVFRDPYILDFLGLKDTYSEEDLEKAILREMESFLLELGAGFTFVARQMRIVVDGEDFYLDLLFYHRKLRRLVAIDLKLEKFKAAYKGQMELYLRWLEKHLMEAGEELPFGLILCESAGQEQIELLQLDESSIRVASYWTELPAKELLQQKLRAATEQARARLERKETS